MSKSISSRQSASSLGDRRQVGTASVRSTPRTNRNKGSVSGRAFHMPFEDKNMLIILIGIGVIGLGYFLMSQGDVMGFLSLTLAPIVLCIGYLIVVPYGIMFGAREFRNRQQEKMVIEEQTIQSTI